MNNLLNFLTENEKKTRKHWLRLTIFQHFFIPFLFTIGLTFYLFTTKHSLKESLTSIVAYLIVTIFNALSFWWIYHCAYKKMGTALLGFFLIVTPISWSFILWDIVQKPDAGGWFAVILFWPFIIWWYVLSYKLRKMNKKAAALFLEQAQTISQQPPSEIPSSS